MATITASLVKIYGAVSARWKNKEELVLDTSIARATISYNLHILVNAGLIEHSDSWPQCFRLSETISDDAQKLRDRIEAAKQVFLRNE